MEASKACGTNSKDNGCRKVIELRCIAGNAAPPMDANDWWQFAMKMTVFARLGETVLLQVEQGLLPPDAIQRLGYGGWASTFATSRQTDEFAIKVACIWPLIRGGVSESFHDYVDLRTASARCRLIMRCS